MNEYKRVCLTIGLLLLFPVVSSAAIVVTGLKNTGEDVTLGPPDTDNVYNVTYGGGPTTADAVVVSPINGLWVANDADSQWISVQENAKGHDLETVIYDMSFTVTADVGDDLTTLDIFGKWSADDEITEVIVNGTTVAGLDLLGPGIYQSLHSFTISGSDATWVTGTNKIEFKVLDTEKIVSGFRVDAVGWRAAPNVIPEPGTLAVWGLLGLCGLGFLRRRRKT